MSVTSQHLTPNTMIQGSMLSENAVLCCGEDPTVVREALSIVGLRTSLFEHDFRSYHLIKYEGLTVILAAIGTGALEPLLFEILRFKIVRVIVLVGTAGRTSSSKTIIGQPYIINKAYLEGTALDREVNNLPLSPNYDLTGVQDIASIVSTDFYYGFSVSHKPNDYPGRLPRLQKHVEEMIAKVDLVDMEVGQFFALCRLLSPEGQLKYLAVKGPANNLGHGEEQNIYAKEVLVKALGKALDILKIRIPDPKSHVEHSHQKFSPGTTKLMEEVKLYWTIQTGIVSMLGFLATNIDFGRPGKSSGVIFCAILLVGVGAIYNLVGNYYAYHEGEPAKVHNQENIVTPSVAAMYGVLAAILGLLLGYALFRTFDKHSAGLCTLVEALLPSVMYSWLKLMPTWTFIWIKVLMPLGTATGVFGVLVFVVRLVYAKLLEVGTPGYKKYSQPLQTMLRVKS